MFVPKSTRSFAVALTVVFALASLSSFLPARAFSQEKTAPIKKQVDDARSELEKLGPAPRRVVLIAKVIRPSVVSIVTKTKVAVRVPRRFFPDWPFGGRDPHEDLRKSPQSRQTREYIQRGLGSGVIVTKEGHILTNNHVVQGADEITVVLYDRSELPAVVVGTDPKTDLAIIRLKEFKPERIVPARLGDSTKLEAGDPVVAVGAPFGLPQSISAGIVSATGRTRIPIIRRQDAYQNFIQTDAAINRGNSGGPLVNYKGEVIGINTAMASSAGGNQGVGFAIPTSIAKNVMDQLISKGRVVRGYLGVIIREATKDDVENLKLEKPEGVVIQAVQPDTPASDAGLKVNDVIIAIDGKPTLKMRVLRNLIARIPPDTKVKFTILRDGKKIDVDVTIMEQPDSAPTLAARPFVDEDLGIVVQTLTAGIARRLSVNGQLGVYRGQKGVLVTAVEPDSPAAKAGIKAKDLIKEVANTPVRTVDDYRRARKGGDLKQGVLLMVKSGKTAKIVTLKSQK